MAPSILRIGRYRLSLAEGVGAFVLATVAFFAARGGLLWLSLMLVPFLYFLFRRTGFEVEDALVLVAVVEVLIAVTMPSVQTHCERRNRPQSDVLSLSQSPDSTFPRSVP